MPLLKICGLQRTEDAAACAELGVDVIGCIVNYPEAVPWRIQPQQARRLIEAVRGKARSCIVTGGLPREILALAEQLRPDMIQLHYKETLEETRFLARRLADMGISVIKAIPIRPDGSCEMAEFACAEEAAQVLAAETEVSMLLLDARCAAAPMAKYGRIDLSLYQRTARAIAKPLLLAGGLTSAILPEILHQIQPYGVDILTGAEQSPGVKDYAKLRILCQICGKSV